MGPQHTFNSPHLPRLTFPYISPYLPHTPSHFPTPSFIPLLLHPFFLPPHPNTFSYYPHISLHLLKVWRSYHVTKFLWRSYCGEVTMWRSYWQPLILHVTRVRLPVVDYPIHMSNFSRLLAHGSGFCIVINFFMSYLHNVLLVITFFHYQYDINIFIMMQKLEPWAHSLLKLDMWTGVY